MTTALSAPSLSTCTHKTRFARFRPDARSLAMFYGTAAVLDAATTVYALSHLEDVHEANGVMRYVMETIGLGGFAAVRILMGLLLAVSFYKVTQAATAPKWFIFSMRLQGHLLPLPVLRRYFKRCESSWSATAYRILCFATLITCGVVVSNVVKIATDSYGRPLYYFADRYATQSLAGEVARLLGLTGVALAVTFMMLLAGSISLLLADRCSVAPLKATLMIVGVGVIVSSWIASYQYSDVRANLVTVQTHQDDAIAAGEYGIVCRNGADTYTVTGPAASCPAH